ncbi:MAG: cytoskeleton protein RodZ [Plesiomonas sp.]|uniref:cytoskeleton protein RodZ n=1 Tax=Plesiomonas sp. TaxID=2486279 RepID=UPI003F369BFE
MNTEVQHDETALTPGQRLRQAREQLGYSQAQVAERLCLKHSVVRALEDDNLTSDLAPTFIRGYVRSYARLVNLPEQEMVTAINAVLPAEPTPHVSMQSFSSKKERRSHDNRLMLFTWVLLFVVISLTGLWWWQNYQVQQADVDKMTSTLPVETSLSASAQSTSTQSSSAGSEEAVDSTVNADPAVSTNAADLVTSSAVGTVVDTTGTTVPVTNTADSAANTTAVVSTEQPVRLDINGQPVSLPAATNSTASASPETVVATTETATTGLQLRFTGDCWLEIKDATGKKLTSGLQKQGATLTLSGTEPYRLTIGAPASVSLDYNGKPVDLRRYAVSGRVARFSLPLTE